MQTKQNKKKLSNNSSENNYSYLKKCFNLFLYNLQDQDK